ncbi:S-layer homology domain-containing protein [Flavonifractor sp. An10]|uniref:S-layer homology domain-containing protein n=1 Tax=Flavonifractor sp. An10 TaxID=1965537 RepID=UPI000B3662BB|nr:S-layer homology domain-containing protein [Flavonifractor sp. An10]OUQ82728.1 hypothetical protein B5E42_08555 [Flavonifractor sp. An10]
MRNLKRALSLVLAVVMVIGLMVVGAGAVSYNDFSDREEIVNKDAVSMLTTLEIIQGLPDGSYDPTGNVDRAQMAKMISVTLTNNQNCDTLYTNVDSGLTDIAANWARGFINYCYVRGIIAGRGDNTFDPSANVTGVEAAKMLLAALGYNADIEGLVGPDWALNTAALAQQLGIFRNFTKDVSEPLNRDDAALLIYNALDVELIQEYRNGYAISYDDHRTILSSVFGVMRVEGVVVGNEWAQLEQTDSEAALREGRTTLENVIVYDSTTANTVVDEGVRYDGVVPFNVTTPVDYMGKAVTLYVEKTTVLSNSKVIGVATKDDMNVILTTASTEDTSKDYLKGTGVTVDEDTEYYVNYGYQANEAAAIETINEHANYDLDQTEDYFVANGIEVEVIDNNDDGKAEYVLYTMETLSEVRSYSERNEEFTLYAPGRDPKGELDNTADSFAVDFEDAVYPNGDTIATDDLVLYVQYGGRTYITLPEIVSGTMTRLDRDEDNELYITLDNGKEYRQSFIPDAASKVDVELTHFDIDEPETRETEPGFDDMFDFILDSNGYVVAIRPTEEPEINYGLVIESAWTQNALTKEGEIKILKADGTTAKYDIDWDASVDPAFGDDSDKLEAYLGTRDVNTSGGSAQSNLNAAVGTVILYSLNEDETELTINKVLGLHEDRIVDGLVTAPKTNTDRNFGDGKDDTYAYIDKNDKAPVTAAQTDSNLEWTLDEDYDKGDASIFLTSKVGNDDVEYAIDRNTVAFYFVRNADGTISYSAAIGWNNMGDVDAYNKDNKDLNVDVQVYPVEKKTADKTWETTHLAEVVLINAETVVTSRDYMLVLSRNAYTKDDTLWLNVVFEDGTAKEIEIDEYSKSTFNPEDTTCYMNAYAYVENADGTYDIVDGTRIEDYNAELLLNGTVENTKNEIYALPDDADVWDVTDMTTAKDDIREGEFSYIECHSVIVPTTVNGRTIRTAFVWEIDDTTETPVQGARYTDNVTRDSLTGAYELRWHDVNSSRPTINDVRDLMADFLGENIVSVTWDAAIGTAGGWNVTTGGDSWSDWGMYEVESIQVHYVSYGGEYYWMDRNAGYTATFDASEALKKDTTGDVAVIIEGKVDVKDSGVSYTTGNSEFTYSWPGIIMDVALTDGYQVKAAGGVTFKYDSDGNGTYDATYTPSSTTYVADGVVLEVTGDKAGSGKYVQFTEDGVAFTDPYRLSGTKNTTEYTVTKPVTIGELQVAEVFYNGDSLGFWKDNDLVYFDTTSTSFLIDTNIGTPVAGTVINANGREAVYTLDMGANGDDGEIFIWDAYTVADQTDSDVKIFASLSDAKTGSPELTYSNSVAVGTELFVTATGTPTSSTITLTPVTGETGIYSFTVSGNVTAGDIHD